MSSPERLAPECEDTAERRPLSRGTRAKTQALPGQPQRSSPGRPANSEPSSRPWAGFDSPGRRLCAALGWDGSRNSFRGLKGRDSRREWCGCISVVSRSRTVSPRLGLFGRTQTRPKSQAFAPLRPGYRISPRSGLHKSRRRDADGRTTARSHGEGRLLRCCVFCVGANPGVAGGAPRFAEAPEPAVPLGADYCLHPARLLVVAGDVQR